MPNVTVKVLHNLTYQEKRTPLAPYVARDELVQVARFEIGVHEDCLPLLLEFIFERLNNRASMESWAREYHRRDGHRALSVGDVVVLGEQAHVVCMEGWQPVTVTAYQVWYDLGKIDKKGITNGATPNLHRPSVDLGGDGAMGSAAQLSLEPGTGRVG